jgi:uncharacterized damage-inducible protein DinB
MAVKSPNSPSFVERFCHWYEYEKDCNAKALQMLQSVPVANRSSASFARAVGKMAHLVAARHAWAHRLGVVKTLPESGFPSTPLEELPAAIGFVEQQWTEYLGNLSESDLDAEIAYTGRDGKRYRWRLLDLLTQVFGHAWYHRGQIAMLVHDLGGTAVDTDYIFWDRPSIVPG